MKWVVIVIALYLLSIFLPLYYVFGQDAKPQLTEGQTLAGSIISNLQRLKQQITQLENEFSFLSGKFQTLEQQLENSERVATALGMLVDDQLKLYKKSLLKWKLLFYGLIGLLVIYNILKAYLRIKWKIRLW